MHFSLCSKQYTAITVSSLLTLAKQMFEHFNHLHCLLFYHFIPRGFAISCERKEMWSR